MRTESFFFASLPLCTFALNLFRGGMMGLLIHNVTIFTNDEQNRILRDYAVAVEGARITARIS
jgi:hypothetical protein